VESYFIQRRAALQEDAAYRRSRGLDCRPRRRLSRYANTRAVACYRDSWTLRRHPSTTEFRRVRGQTLAQVGEWGEPDLLLLMYSRGQIAAGIVIECEVWVGQVRRGLAGRSATHRPAWSVCARPRRTIAARCVRLVLYLTADAAPPVEELRRSRLAIQEKTRLPPDQVLRVDGMAVC